MALYINPVALRMARTVYNFGYSECSRVKHWPTDLKVLGSSHICGGDLFNRKPGSIAHNLSLSPAHCPVMTEIWFKRT